jgi:hypothetical protein
MNFVGPDNVFGTNCASSRGLALGNGSAHLSI